jgi:predicted CoA-binding protein
MGVEMNDEALIESMLRSVKTIAVLGISDKSERASFNIARYLKAEGYRIAPVNPVLKEVLGKKCYPTLKVAQEELVRETGKGIDLVDVFRASEFVPGIVDEVLALGIKNLWLQDGVTHAAAVAKARAAGVNVVEDDCIFRRHAALVR